MPDMHSQNRHFILAEASDIIQRLPLMGKLMIIGKGNGATHERIGKVETVTQADGRFICAGAHHRSCIDPSLVADIVLDASSIMQDQVYPRLDFRKADGATLFAAVGFEGLEPFAAALEDQARTVDPETRDMSRPKRPDVDPLDPGFSPLAAAMNRAAPVTIRYDEQGFSQSWTGVIPKVSPGMGFINIMTEDFHLHLLGGAVARWREDVTERGATRLTALNSIGDPIGLSLIQPERAPGGGEA